MADPRANVDEYIAGFPVEVQAVLEAIRGAIHDAVPNAGERISYQIPTITLGGKSLVYFAGWKNHVSIYPVPDGDAEFREEIVPFRASKGTLHFPLGSPVPYELIGRMAAHLARERSDVPS